MGKTGKMGWEWSVFVLILLAISKLGSTAPTFLYYYCSNHTYYAATDTSYPNNLQSVIISLTSSAATSTTGFATATAGNGTEDAVFGLFLCRGDQSTASCSDCVNTALSDQPKKSTCPRQSIMAIIWYDECMIRYGNQSFFGRMDQVPQLGLWNTQNITGNQTQFGEMLGQTLIDVAIQTANGGPQKKYGTKRIDSFLTMYVLEQCTPDLSANDCIECLANAIAQMIVRQGGRIITPSCSFRYEVYPFYNVGDIISSPPSPPLPLPLPPALPTNASSNNPSLQPAKRREGTSL